MKLTIERIAVKDFRNLNAEYAFGPGANFVTGANGTGKSNLLHAITWTLFGKTIDDRAKFEAQPLNADGTRTEKEPDVTLTLGVDGETITLRRFLKDGNKTQTFVNEAPSKTLKEFDELVASLFGSTNNFKLYTNPLHFPENLTWQQQRELFMQFFTLPAAKEVIATMESRGGEYAGLAKALSQKGHSAEKEQDKLTLELKQIKEEQAKRSAQIELLDEQLAAAPAATNQDELIAERDRLRAERAKIQAHNNDADQYNAKEASKIATARTAAENKWNKARNEYQDQIRERKDKRYELARQEQRLTDKILDLTAEFNQLNATTDDNTCPQCGQELPHSIQEGRENYQQQTLQAIHQKGRDAARQRKEIQAQLAELDNQPQPEAPDMDAHQRELEAIEAKRPKPVKYAEFKDQQRLDQLEAAVARYEVNQENQNRRKELAELQRTLGRRFEQTENALMDLTEFFQARAEILIERVNSQFREISIKVLDIQKDGKSKETFEITKDGVPYAELNTAGRLQAGLELSNFIKSALDVETPVLIDNGERYPDVDLTAIPGQLIATIATQGAELSVTERTTA